MIHYLRIPKSKFWGWVFSSLAVGLVLGGFAAYALSRGSLVRQVDDLQSRLQTQTSQAASNTSALQAQLSSTEASLSAVSQQYASLKSQPAKSSSSTGNKSSSTATTTLAVLSRSVSPSQVATGDNITMTAKVQGHPDQVTMRVYNTSVGYDDTFVLRRVLHTSSTETWRSTTKAPTKIGTYHYYATAALGGKSVTKTGATPATFRVN